MSDRLHIAGDKPANRIPGRPVKLGPFIRCEGPDGQPVFFRPEAVMLVGAAQAANERGAPLGPAIGVCVVMLMGGTTMTVKCAATTMAEAIAQFGLSAEDGVLV